LHGGFDARILAHAKHREHQVRNNMKILLHIALVIGLLASLTLRAQAFPRPYAPKLSCGEIKGMIQQKGAVLLSTGPFTFDRFVRDQGYCMQGEITDPAWIVSLDQPQCYAGYTCGGRQPSYN